MTANIFDNGNVEMYQGDDIHFYFYGVPTDDDYDVFLEIQDPETRTKIANQLQVKSGYQDFVDIHALGDYTKLMTVPIDAKYKIYNYTAKYCKAEKGIEQTFLIGGKKIGELNTIKVYPQGAEGA